MKVLIAGATGLLGRELVKQSLNKEISVHFLTTRPDQVDAIPGAKGFVWDPSKGVIDPSCIDGVQTVINLAGATVSKKWTPEYKKLIRESRKQPAEILYKLLSDRSHSVGHYVSSSGISWYPSSQEARYTEDHSPAANSFLGEVTKLWEESANHFTELGIRVAVVRTGLVLDRDQGALPKLLTPVKLGVGAPLGSGKQWQSWIHIEDIAGIYLHIVRQSLEGVYNGVGPHPVTNRDITRQLGMVINRPVFLPPVPAWLLRMVLGEMSSLVLEGQWVSSAKIEEAGYRFVHPELKEALEQLLKRE